MFDVMNKFLDFNLTYLDILTSVVSVEFWTMTFCHIS